jgi:tetratricopeptide (TPR) repeat protein
MNQNTLILLVAFICALLFLPLEAQPVQLLKQMRLAETLCEAGEYQEAISKYGDLLEYPLQPWQTALIKYNIGTVLLSSGQWTEALSQFHSIPTLRLPAQLDASLKRNISLADLMLARAQLEGLKSSGNVQDFEHANFLFLQFHLDFEAAVQAACRLSQAIGGQCRLPPELREMEQEAVALFTRYLEALSNFQQAAGQLPTAPSDTPKALLKSALRQQETAKQMAQLRQMGESENDQTLQQAQDQVLQTAARFLPGVLQTEEYNFAGASGPQTGCQCHPWDGVIPLFLEGKEQAEEASALLSAESLDLTEVQQAQQAALLKWQKALKLLENSEQESRARQQEAAKEPQKAAEAQEKEKAASQADRALLRSLQDMEEDDKSRPINRLNKGSAQGEQRPW